jgi:hypothetical protein
VKNLYLALAVVGAVAPYVFFVQHFAQEGLGLPAFVAAVFANPAAGGFTADLVVSSAVFWLAMLRERRLGTGPSPWLFVVLNLAIGLSCALPAYLFAREHRRQLGGVAA